MAKLTRCAVADDAGSGSHPGDPALRVLVIDDELLIRWAVAQTLTRAGCLVVEATDAASAVRATTDTGPFDVVVMDLRLPDVADLSLVRRIRRDTPRTAIVVMTAFGSSEIVAEACALGVYAVVNKPFDLEHVDDVVRRAYAAQRR
jgi:two-component system, NtrC family, response regulator HydG